MRKLTFGIGLASLLALLVLGGCRRHTTDADIESISLGQLRSLLQRAQEQPEERVLLLIDPRAPARFAEQHIAGARNVQLSDVPATGRRREIEAFQNVVVYGDNPASAPAVAMTKRLISAGYNDPLMFRGGLDAWVASGLETERSEQSSESTDR